MQLQSPQGLPLEWLQGVVDTDNFKKILSSQSKDLILKQLKRILQRRLVTASMEKESDYENPNWANKQAHMNGVRQTLLQLINLLYFVE